MKTLVRILAGILVASGSSLLCAGDNSIRVHNPWIREAPPAAEALAAYMRIENTGEKTRILTGASSPVFGNVMLHGTRIQDGLAQMFHLDQVPIPPKGDAMFEPGGNHVMLMNPKKPLVAGDHVDLELDFQDGSRIPVMLEVRKAAADAHMHQ